MKGIQKALARNNGLFAFCIAAFLLGVPVGYSMYDRIEGMMLPVLKQLKETFSKETDLETAINIFLNNYRVSIYLVVAGTLILPTLVIMFSNGFLIGFIIKYLQLKDLDYVFFLKGVIPHGIFELPALFIAGGIGLRIGLSFLSLDNRKIVKEVSQSIREAAVIHLVVVTPLLILAAFIETYISAALIK
jgi:stage II sporulation protein M